MNIQAVTITNSNFWRSLYQVLFCSLPYFSSSSSSSSSSFHFSPNSRGQQCLTCNFQTNSRNNPLITQPISWETLMYGSASTVLCCAVLCCAVLCCAVLCCETAAAAALVSVTAFWGLIIFERPWRGCKWRLAWEREEWAKLTRRTKLYCSQHVTCLVVLTDRHTNLLSLTSWPLLQN